MKLKLLIWKMLGKRFQHNYSLKKIRCKSDFKKLSNWDGNNKAFLLLDTPTHGNRGDQAIVLAERDFLKSRFPEADLWEFTFEECKFCAADIEALTPVNDNINIIIHGGGFIGTLWEPEQENLLHILECFREKKMIIFPQTIFFEDSKKGKEEKERFLDRINACKNITIFTRDKASYQWMENQKFSTSVKYELVPDIVTTLKYDKKMERKREILLCLRQDEEKNCSKNQLKSVEKSIEKVEYEVRYTDTFFPEMIPPSERQQQVQAKLDEFAKSSLVITDRLHGMIFSAITATPCIALDNISRKVSGGYEWIKYLDYVTCVEDGKITEELVREMISKHPCHYDNKPLQEYYKRIEEVLCE